MCNDFYHKQVHLARACMAQLQLLHAKSCCHLFLGKVKLVRGLQSQQLHINLTLMIRACKHNAWHDLVEASMCAVHQLHMLSNQTEPFKWLTQLSGLSGTASASTLVLNGRPSPVALPPSACNMTLHQVSSARVPIVLSTMSSKTTALYVMSYICA